MTNKKKRLSRIKREQELNKFPMEHFVSEANRLGVINPQQAMENLSPSGKVVHKHFKVLRRLEFVAKGNRHNKHGNANEARNYRDRKRKLDAALDWLSLNGFDMGAPDVA